MKKLRSNRGETLVETLSALLIAVLVMAFLALAVVTASQINKKTDSIDSPLFYTDAKSVGTVSVTITEKNSTSKMTATVNEYKTADGRYHYYEKE